MTEILQMFTGNPLTTYVGKRIEAATSPDLEADDWALNMEIVDMINQNDDDAKDALRAIKKRLQQIEQDRNFVVTNRTLTVLETCVKNCSKRFHIFVMSKDFIQDLVKLIGPKNNPPIDLQERVLKLIERWADEFRNQPDLSGVVMVYNDLKTKGVTFPPKDQNSMVPIQTPQRSVPSPTQQAQSQQSRLSQQQQQPASNFALHPQPAGPVVLDGDGYTKITQDLGVVQTSVEMFNDIMKILETKGDESDWKLASDLNTTCHQMKDRIVDLIERVANEDLTIELLRLNDELNNIFTKYDRLVKNNIKQASKSSSTTTTPSGNQQNLSSSSNIQAPARVENELSLIDFNVDDHPTSPVQPLTAVTTTIPSSSAAASTTKGTKDDKKRSIPEDDPFDSSIAITKAQLGSRSVDPLASNLDKLNLNTNPGSSSAGPIKQHQSSKPKMPEEISSVREQDFAEIENWLSTDSGRNLASIGADLPSVEPISIPNSEFDNFIASRALAGSTSTTPQETQRTATRRPEPST